MPIKIDRDRVEFLGLEIIFIGEDDPRGSVWVPFNEELSLLYGKNGAGKSTILNAIKTFAAGTTPDEGIIIQGFARLINPDQTCSFMDQAVNDMPNTRFLSEWEEIDAAEINSKFADMASALQLPHAKWESSLFGAVPESVDDLEMNWDKFVSHYLFLGLWEHDIRHDFPAIKSFIHHLIDERTFCLQPTGKDGDGEWTLSLAAHLDNEETREGYEHLLLNPELRFFDEDLENHVSQILLNTEIISHREDIPRTNSPYVPAIRIDGRKINSLDLSVVDLNDELDLKEWTNARVAELVHSAWVKILDPWFADHPALEAPTRAFLPQPEFAEDESEDSDLDGDEGELVWSATFSSRNHKIGQTIELDFNSERQEVLQKALSFIALELPKELGISDLRLELAIDLGVWLYGEAGTLEAYDQRSNSWIPVEKMSNATQKIIGMALKIHAEIRSRDQVVIAIGDEVDQGLHTLAISGLFRMLGTSIPACFIATHSSVALSSRIGERLHVHRGAEGDLLLSRIGSTELANTAATKLGVSVHELIGMIDLVVAVEGQHDKSVIEHFLRRDERLSHTNILIISMTGINNSTNLVDAEFILNFTDLRILAVADNASKSDLAATWNDALNRTRNGEPAKKLAHHLRERSKALREQRWHEQRCMIDLLAVATERGLLKRIRTTGHIYADIEMCLDPLYFGLEKDWLTLEAEFLEYKSDAGSAGKNFKDYLRSTYNVSITVKSIETALSMTTTVPTGIQLILDEILTNSIQANLFDQLIGGLGSK